MIVFQSAYFSIVGELRIPKSDNKTPLVIMVHGDGPAYRNYFSKLKENFLRAGYATLIWDKPGYGESTGKYSREHLRQERAHIFIDAIQEMKNDKRIDPGRIGVWGISQAGYVIPMALAKTNDLAFMILAGAPGENGIEQTAYFIGQQILCEGYPEEQVREAETLVAKVSGAKTYEEYVENGKILLEKYPIVKALDYMAGILPADRWQPEEANGEAYYDPMAVIAQTSIPTLVFFGEKDRNCDPIQGVAAYQTALTKSGNQNFQVWLIPGADHDIILCETGCEKERSRRTAKQWSNYAPEYLERMEAWLRQLSSSDY